MEDEVETKPEYFEQEEEELDNSVKPQHIEKEDIIKEEINNSVKKEIFEEEVIKKEKLCRIF